MANLAIIPARGGSKRIPRKNIKEFCGKPIIAYSIEVAIKSNLFDEIMVSTDDNEIAEVAKKYGAKVPFRRSCNTSNDSATTIDVLLEVLEDYKKMGLTFDHACCLYPTSPLTKIGDIQEGYNKLGQGKYDSVFPIVNFGYPIWRALEVEDDKIKMIWPENLNARSQDLKKAYHDAGQWYWFVPDKISDRIFTNNSSSIILPEERVQDIDNLSDWKLAEIKYKLSNEVSQ